MKFPDGNPTSRGREPGEMHRWIKHGQDPAPLLTAAFTLKEEGRAAHCLTAPHSAHASGWFTNQWA